MPHIEVVGAVIRRGQEVLIAQRMPGKHEELLWEFPGGKLEPGEAPEACLEREIAEELAVRIRVGEPVGAVTHDDGARRIHLTCYWAELVSGEPRAVECHAVRWVRPEALDGFDFAPADVPLVERVKRLLGA